MLIHKLVCNAKAKRLYYAVYAVEAHTKAHAFLTTAH